MPTPRGHLTRSSPLERRLGQRHGSAPHFIFSVYVITERIRTLRHYLLYFTQPTPPLSHLILSAFQIYMSIIILFLSQSYDPFTSLPPEPHIPSGSVPYKNGPMTLRSRTSWNREISPSKFCRSRINWKIQANNF